MKKLMVVLAVTMVAASVFAAGGRRKSTVKAEVGSDEAPITKGKEAQVEIVRYPMYGTQSWRSFSAQSIGISGASNIGVLCKKPRHWIVLETEYLTRAKTLSQLTFTWHVLLETKNATNKDKEAQKKMSPYSYFTTTVTYQNIPRGSHAASVCLHPSYLECYGDPVAVAIVVTNENGEELGGDTVTSTPKWFRKSDRHKFWEDDSIMNATGDGGMPMVERRQGLLDRSKTIWALVNPCDYELVQ